MKSVLHKACKSYHRLKIYLHNTGWILGEKFFSLGLNFAVTLMVARYLGPESFGILAYAVSLMTLFAVLGHVGLNGLAIREFVRHPEQKATILGTIWGLKLIGCFIAFSFLLAYVFIAEDLGSLEFNVTIIVAFALIFKPFNVIDFWFQSKVQARYPAMVRTISALASAIAKLALIFIGSGLLLFAMANLLQGIIAAVGLVYVFKKISRERLVDWRFSLAKGKDLLKRGSLIFIGAFFATIYLKIDQIMLRWFSGTEEVGVYALAASLSEVWYFLPTAIIASIFPSLIHLHKSNPDLFNHRLQQIFDLLFICALGIALIVQIGAPIIMPILLGDQYLGSISILMIHIWAGIFVFMRAAVSKWILIENFLIYSLVSQCAGALMNVGLNLLLIPSFAGQGAAFATLISYATASYLALLIYPKTRQIFSMMTIAMVSPIRYPFNWTNARLTNFKS